MERYRGERTHPSAPPPPPRRDAALRILHITESAQGGVGSYLNQILPEVTSLCGATMRVVIPREHRFMLARVADDAVAGYRRDARRLIPLLRLAWTAWRELRAFRPDVVHCHSTFAGLALRPLLWLLAPFRVGPRPAVVYSPHGWAFQMTGSPGRRRAIVAIERALAWITDRIVVLSDAEHRECRDLGFPADRLVRIYNGIAADPPAAIPAPWQDSRRKVLFVGRLDRQKGVDTLLAAAAAAPDRLCVRCIGVAIVESALPATVPDNVELLGWLDEAHIAGHLEQADVVAVPSRWEGFGLVAAEAMRARRPVVASRIGGLPEVVEDGVTGHLVPPDDVIALRDALLAGTPDERRAMGEAGHARFAALFTARRSADHLLAAYRAALVAKMPRRLRMSRATG